MAKLNGPLGSKLRGKVGEVVAAKTVGGATAIRAYQPVVKNPKTTRQQNSRGRFAATSGLAAKFAKIIGIGYANVAGGMKMYPRNIFVRDAVKNKLYVMMSGADVEALDLGDLKVSAQSGITVIPTLRWDATEHMIMASNYRDVELAAGQQLGLVVVCYYVAQTEAKVLYTGMNEAGTGVAIPQSVYQSGIAVNVVGFYKIIEPSGNDIVSDTLPWKYPSPTSATSGMVTIPASN